MAAGPAALGTAGQRRQIAGSGLRSRGKGIMVEQLRATLDKAAQTGAGISRALVYAPRDPVARIYEGASWFMAFVGGSHEFLRDGARMLDARTEFHYQATVVTPAMAHAQIGAGSAYAYIAQDVNGDALGGSKTYTLTLPPNPPAKNFRPRDTRPTGSRPSRTRHGSASCACTVLLSRGSTRPGSHRRSSRPERAAGKPANNEGS